MNERFQVISPVDQSIYLERSFASDGEIESALKSAYTAQGSWKSVPLEERMTTCKRMVEWMLGMADHIGEELTWQMGRPLRYSPLEITKGFRERAEHMIRISPAALSDQMIESSDHFVRFIRREALGTVLVLAPWNYPYLTAVNVVVPAILAGNTVILKHAQQTPRCSERFAEAFHASGLPTGVFQALHLTHEQVERMIKDKRVSQVSFTGSVEGGRAIQAAASQRFVAAGLEMGGKDPAYVCADCDINYTIENLVDGAFFNSGQSCCGVERVYVDEQIFDDFIEGFVDLTRQYRLGNPIHQETTLGPMVRISAARYVQSQIDQATSKGAKCLIDSSSFEMHRPGSPYLAPQVLIDVDHTMDIMREETFGPAVGIMPVRNEGEAIKLMNDSRYGLTASIWTSDAERARRLGDLLDTGTCYMNRCDYLDPALTWTGVKDSGRGATLSTLGFDMLTRPKSFHLKVTT